MKKIIVLVIMFFCLYFIYCIFDKNTVNYISISDNSLIVNYLNYNDYIKEYLVNNNRLGTFNTNYINKTIRDTYKDVLNNRTIRDNSIDYYYKKVLRESDFVIINVGMEEFAKNFNRDNIKENYQYFNKMFDYISKLISEIRKYAQETIVFLGYYNPTNYYDARVDELFCDIDIKLNDLMVKNNVIYIDLYEKVKQNHFNNGIYINKSGQLKIANILKFYLD